MLVFGSLVKIPATDRVGVFSGILTINKKTTFLIYPISSYIYLASSQDFICKSSFLYDALMVETWNPVLLTKQHLEIVDTIANDSLSLYEKFLYSSLLFSEFEERKLFTGPPIVSSTDVRHLFRLQERKIFDFLLRPYKNILIPSLNPISL